MSKFDTCIYAEYFGDYGMRLCNHPSRGNKRTIYQDSCRKCGMHTTERKLLEKCPFCGNYAKASGYRGRWHVKCAGCPAEMSGRTLAEAAMSWNSRV